MRFHPRFEVGEDGERLEEKVLRVPPEVIEFVRQYVGASEEVDVREVDQHVAVNGQNCNGKVATSKTWIWNREKTIFFMMA